MSNASRRFADAYMAQALVPDFLQDAAALVDEYALLRSVRLARTRGTNSQKHSSTFENKSKSFENNARHEFSKAL
jgi:hypothetical protein